MILIALGANLPSRAGTPAAALRAALGTLPQRNVAIEAVSPFYKSTAWPDPSDPEFVNAVARIRTELSSSDLLALLKSTERAFGRESAQRNAPRTLDLDILDHEGHIDKGPPTLPHPRLQERGFVLIPLRDVAPDWRHPVSGLSVDTLIEFLPAAARALRRLE
ncbi:MAG TPA: 2-amino-4-hydroxy-6-hydroxymethyldihydropteridine diphosphokinase [Rhizomicrobium sp.]|nr:2-amino-4-hydroxy-6-hydroxymethyldihydropteridine diphosphokinase [Rhizomicrobium sp.]